MANNINRCVFSKMRLLGVIKQFYKLRKRIWYTTTDTPSVDANSHTTYPVRVGDLVFEDDNGKIFVCKTAPTASVAAEFVEITQGE